MDNLNSKTKQLHDLSIEQVKCYDDYFNKMIELERILSDCRINVSMAKAQNGFALSSVGFNDKRDIEPTMFVNVKKDEGIFEILNSKVFVEEEEGEKEEAKVDVRKRGGKGSKKEKSDKKKVDEDDKEEAEEKKKDNKSLKPQFRPFGLLEPRAAKQARIKGEEAIHRVCELSTIQAKIFSIENLIVKLNSEVIKSLGDEYENIVKINETSSPSDSVKKLLKQVKWLQMPAA